MKNVYRDWAGYSSGIFAFIVMIYFVMLVPSTDLVLLIASIFLVLAGVASLLLIKWKVIFAEFTTHATKGFGITSIVIGAMCFVGYLTK